MDAWMDLDCHKELAQWYRSSLVKADEATATANLGLPATETNAEALRASSLKDTNQLLGDELITLETFCPGNYWFILTGKDTYSGIGSFSFLQDLF